MRQRTGTITETDEGRFRVRMTMPTGDRPTLGVYDSWEEADTQRSAAVAIMADEGPTDGWTIRAWGDKWLTARELGRTIRDPQSDWGRFNHHIKDDPIAKMYLKSVRRRHVRDWLKRVRSKVARQTALNTLNVMRGMLSAAVEDELLKTNPAAGLKLPKEKRSVQPWTFATLPEQSALVNAVAGPERYLIAFAIGTGLRAGELCTLRLADVHVDDENPHVVVRYGTVPDLPTKGGKIREVPLFGLGLEATKAWLAALPAWTKKNPHKLLFPRLRGGFRDERHVLRWTQWTGAKKAAAITRRFRFHDLRHTAASSLVSGWWGRQWSLTEVRDFLGHESITTTERYAHLAGTALQKAAADTANRYQSVGVSLGGQSVSSTISSGVPDRIRTCDPRFRKSQLSAVISSGYDVDDRLRSVSIAFLTAVATGDEMSAAAFGSQLGALYVADTVRAIELADAIVSASMPAPAQSVSA